MATDPKPKPVKPIELEYDEPTAPAPSPIVRLEEIFGMFPRVSAAPTWKPRTFAEHFAYYKNGATYRFYFFFPNDNTWHYVTAT